MGQFEQDAKGFAARKQEEVTEARQLAAVSLACGMDLHLVLEAPPEARAALKLKLRHAIERERLKGTGRHWSYDLNRHIALKQILDKLGDPRGEETRPRAGKQRQADRMKTNGARRRR